MGPGPALLLNVLLLRSLLFNCAFYAWSTALAVAGLPLLLLPPGWLRAYARFWMGGTAWLLRHAVGLTHEVRGRERLPSGPAIYAVKHQSAWETLVLLLLLPDARIALKRELTLIPLFGWYCLHAGMIRIDRGAGARAMRSLIEGARGALGSGADVIIFPEGTRVAPDAHLPYHPGVAALYLHLGRPVVPVALNSGLFWPRRAFLKRPGRIALEFLSPIGPGLKRRDFMAALEAALEPATVRLVAEARAQPVPGHLGAGPVIHR